MIDKNNGENKHSILQFNRVNNKRNNDICLFLLLYCLVYVFGCRRRHSAFRHVGGESTNAFVQFPHSSSVLYPSYLFLQDVLSADITCVLSYICLYTNQQMQSDKKVNVLCNGMHNFLILYLQHLGLLDNSRADSCCLSPLGDYSQFYIMLGWIVWTILVSSHRCIV